MAILEGGVSGALVGAGEQTGVPMHINSRPIPYGSRGIFNYAGVTGTIAAALAAGAQLFYIRWTDASNYLVLLRLEARFQALTLFTAATLTDFGFDLFKATAVSAGGGGSAIIGSSLSKLHPNMGASLLGSTGMRLASTGALTALTTLDSYPICNSLGDPQRVNPAAATEEQRVNDPTLIYQPDIASGETPLVLGQNEGIVLRNRAVWPAAGTGILAVRATWAEVSAY